MSYLKPYWLFILGLTFNGCVVGCGAPLYPKTLIQIDPATGRIMRSSEMETALVVGSIDAGVNPDGTKWMKIGTTTQPAITYGEEAVGVMKEYANQQEKYNQILDTIGKNAVLQIEAVGNAAGQVLGGILSLRATAAASGDAELCAVCDTLSAKVNELIAKSQAAHDLVDAANKAATGGQ